MWAPDTDLCSDCYHMISQALPCKLSCVAAVAFAPAERELYMYVFERARTKYQLFRSQGPHMVSKRLIQIMSTLLPLRRICSGGQLSNKDLAVVSPSLRF